MSFCRNWDSLLLWSHYSDSHEGICLGFDIPDDSAYDMDVHYQPNVIQINGPEEVDEHFVQRLLRTKHESWSYEQESRMFVARNEPPDERGLHFVDFALSLALTEVIFGAQCEPKHYEPALDFLKQYQDVSPFWAHAKGFFLAGTAHRATALVLQIEFVNPR